MSDNRIIEKIGTRLLGTCSSIDNVLATLVDNPENYDVDTIENDLLDFDVERCENCGWWFESCELVSEDEEITGKCKDCRNE